MNRKKFIFSFFCLCLLIPQGCLLTYHYPSLHVSVNLIGLKKVPLSSFKDGQSNGDFSAIKWHDLKGKEEAMKITGYKYASSLEHINYKGKKISLIRYVDPDRFSKQRKILDFFEGPKKVLSLEAILPVYDFAAFEAKLNNSDYLIVYLNFVRMQNASELFIIDSNFKIVYNEVLTRALEISCDHNKENGDCFLIRSNGFVRKTDKEKWKKINGDWVYFIPSSAK